MVLFWLFDPYKAYIIMTHLSKVVLIWWISHAIAANNTMTVMTPAIMMSCSEIRTVVILVCVILIRNSELIRWLLLQTKARETMLSQNGNNNLCKITFTYPIVWWTVGAPHMTWQPAPSIPLVSPLGLPHGGAQHHASPFRDVVIPSLFLSASSPSLYCALQDCLGKPCRSCYMPIPVQFASLYCGQGVFVGEAQWLVKCKLPRLIIMCDLIRIRWPRKECSPRGRRRISV